MRRFPILGILLLVPALAFLGMTGCTKDPAKTDTPTAGGGKKKGAKAAKITGATDGFVKGVVKFDGEAPKLKLMIDEIMKHKDKDACMAGQAKNPWNVAEQIWLVNKDGGVANVVVSLVPAKGKAYDVKADLKAKWKKNVAVVDQPFCQYIPHVVGLYAEVQPLQFKNSAGVSHNVKVAGGEENGATDVTLESRTGVTKPKPFFHERRFIPVACSIHGWMNAKIVTFQHPYFAVTKSDGTFEIPDVPVGEKLHVHIWHESTGEHTDTGMTVTAKAGEKSHLDLKIK